MGKLYNMVTQDDNLSLFDVLYSEFNLQKQKDIDFVSANYIDGEKEEKLDQIEIDYDLLFNKLAYIPELIGRDENLQRKFAEVFIYIDDLNMDLSKKLDVIASYACVISLIPTHVELLNNENSFLLALSFIGLPIENYSSYGAILSNETVLNSINSNATNINDKKNIIYNMLNYCDLYVYDDMNENDYKKAINECNKIAEKHFVKSARNK